ncbi:type IV secretion system DNA-binding domain-containing protein [Candidatus Wolfebacteria bacterium]|nr:type IV secretion system DNA-binding domain-containing protein [Candidatus Wolfebacteria bacterium]
MFFFLPFIILLISAGLVLYFGRRYFDRKRLKTSLSLQLLSVRLPKHSDKAADSSVKTGSPDAWKDEINLSAQLFGILAGLKSPFALEAAVHHIGEEIYFYVGVPKNSRDAVTRQIEGLWKDAQIQPSEDYNIFNASGSSAGIYLKQTSSYALPIRTYAEANLDTFAPILSALSNLKELGEGAAIQILAKPAAKGVKKGTLQMIQSLKRGASAEDVLTGPRLGWKDVERALKPPPKDAEGKKEERVIDEESVKALEAKISKPLLSVNFRAVSSAGANYEVDSILESIDKALSQFSAPRRQELKATRPRNPKKLLYQFSFREFDDGQAVILNTEELASLFHLPASTTEIPRVKWVKAKEAEAPANLPRAGTFVGMSVFRAVEKPLYITEDDRRRHVYIIGQTGTGKSTVMTNMVIEDIRQNKGVAIIDPHGDLIEKILELIPKERLEDVILFDPSDRWRPLGLNMLEYDLNRPEEKTFIVNEMQSIFNKLFLAETMGPMFEQYMRSALLLLMEDAPNEPATLMEVARVFTDSDFRERKLSRISNPIVIDFWEKEAVKAGGEAALANMTPYITSKFNNFTANDYMRPIIGQPKSAFNFRQVMDEGKILLVNLSKGRIGDINANLLGMVVTGKILMAALSRVDIPELSKRRDFNLYIDEFQNFTTDSIATIMSEARKYGLNLTMAHQFIAQLTEKIRDAVFGNVGNLISFRVGARDAEFLVKQFTPIFSENDLVNIDNFNAYVKILIAGQTAKPFNVRTLPTETGKPEFVEHIKELSRLKYGRDRIEVEEEILRRLRG